MAADDSVSRRDFFKTPEQARRALDGNICRCGFGPDRAPVGPDRCAHGTRRACCE
jgi:hypothetical protein